jgi:hypothetical protein
MGDRADMLSSDRIYNNYNKFVNRRKVHSPSSASVGKSLSGCLSPRAGRKPLRHGRRKQRLLLGRIISV